MINTVFTGEYRGHKYSIGVCSSKDDPRSLGKFFVDSAFNTDSHDTMAAASANVHAAIDAWKEQTPEDETAWVAAITGCMRWTGYEDCEMDHDKVMDVLRLYKERGPAE